MALISTAPETDGGTASFKLLCTEINDFGQFQRNWRGAGCRNRTRDIQFTKLALYQLS
jgi:hypothetical protein